MEKINKMIETVVYLSYDGIEFKIESDCLRHEATQRIFDLCDYGKLLDDELHNAVDINEICYIVGISKEELETLNESLEFLGYYYCTIEPTSNSGNYFWDGSKYRSLESFIDIFKKRE